MNNDDLKEFATFIQDEGKWKECEFLTGEEMAKRATELLRENERLNNRINKAIEYIDNSDILDIHHKNRHDLLDILKGSDKDE